VRPNAKEKNCHVGAHNARPSAGALHHKLRPNLCHIICLEKNDARPSAGALHHKLRPNLCHIICLEKNDARPSGRGHGITSCAQMPRKKFAMLALITLGLRPGPCYHKLRPNLCHIICLEKNDARPSGRSPGIANCARFCFPLFRGASMRLKLSGFGRPEKIGLLKYNKIFLNSAFFDV